MEWALALTTVPSGPCFHFRVRARSQGSRARRIPRDGVRAFKAVVVFHASRRRVLAQRGIPTAHYSHLSLSESWFFVLSDRSTRARSRSRYGRTDGLGVTRAAKQLMRCRFHVSFRKNFAAKRQPTNQPPSWAGWSSAALVDCGANERHPGAAGRHPLACLGASLPACLSRSSIGSEVYILPRPHSAEDPFTCLPPVLSRGLQSTRPCSGRLSGHTAA